MPCFHHALTQLVARWAGARWAWGALAVWLACGPGSAQTVVALAPPSAAPELGALLLAPAERQALDAIRALAARNAAFDSNGTPLDSALPRDTVAAPPVQALQAVANPQLAIDGIVVRQGKKSTIWLNGEPLYGADVSNPLRAKALSAGVVRAHQGGLVLRGKPGEVWDTASGARTDMLPRNAIRIQRSPGKQP